RQERQDEDVAVPEDMAPIAGTREAARSDGGLARVAHRAHEVVEREADRRLNLRSPFDDDVRFVPPRSPAGSVIGEQSLESAALCCGEQFDGLLLRRTQTAESFEAGSFAFVREGGRHGFLLEQPTLR